ncbi:hypothetical protein [Rhodovulum viride]|nr:hypothetical protein [Rhodovulum viride]
MSVLKLGRALIDSGGKIPWQVSSSGSIALDFHQLNERTRKMTPLGVEKAMVGVFQKPVKDFGQSGLLLVLPSFFDPGKAALPSAVSKAAELVGSRPGTPLLIDVRGNTGGDLLRTMPLIDAISEGAKGRQVDFLIDKFTFSAAIVFTAVLKHCLGERLALIGEEMGDGLTFFAEGGTIDLSFSGATVWYSTAFHDWAAGRIDETAPVEIAERIVPIGTLEPDRVWVAPSEDVETLDRFCGEVLGSLNASTNSSEVRAADLGPSNNATRWIKGRLDEAAPRQW